MFFQSIQNLVEVSKIKDKCLVISFARIICSLSEKEKNLDKGQKIFMTPYCTKEGVANASRCVMGASQNESELVRLCLILHIFPTMCTIFSLSLSNLYCNGNIVLDRHFDNERGSFKNPCFLYSWIKQMAN